MSLPPVTPPLASYVGLVVTVLVVTGIGLLARRPMLGGLLATFPSKIPALVLALLLAGHPDEAVRVAQAGPLGLAAVAIFAAGVSLGIPHGTRRALLYGFGGWALAVTGALLLPPLRFHEALLLFALVWLLSLTLAWRAPHGADRAQGAAMTTLHALKKAIFPGLLVFAALWIQPAAGPVLAAALTVLPINTGSALAAYRGDPASAQRAMLASIANLLSSIAFLAALASLVALLGAAPPMLALHVLLAWAAAFGVTLLVRAAMDARMRRRSAD